ncbi:MAG: 4-hydroxy-3-methylbut-2-enyl diphosphate reductase [Agathobacter sp.]|nr:4-hydroxy-3-methylbut-2-enyl diphosphate reductase [Agathobacter sp.]MBQ3559132.1 4-hydroxy-3-methylbut-2-enyl diphosphate reductase [Agathobacter sp.]
MRNVTLAKSAGFCFGVKRAVNMVYEEIDKSAEDGKSTPIYTYGPIIHNDEVVKDFASKGVTLVKELSELGDLEKGKIIVRSHGISRAEYEEMEQYGFTVVDATCPFVRKIHKIVDEHSKQGEYIIIIGNPNHPEVCGIRGWVNGDDVTIIESKEEAENFVLETDKKVCIVSQTTFNYNKFQDLVEIVSKKGYNISVLNTICNATEERQTEARQIAKEVEAMIVIGDKHSSNTQKLFEICNTECEKTYYIQTSKDMDYGLLKSINNVGITAGASTPNNIIEEVSKNVRNEL